MPRRSAPDPLGGNTKALTIFVGFGLVLLALMFLPWVLGRILDPLNAWRIRRYCLSRDARLLDVQPFPNHYGVHYVKDGVKVYAKCKSSGLGRIVWLSNEPER